MEDWDQKILIDLVVWTMPYGRYKGRRLYHLPEPYLVWMQQKDAWPRGRLGELLQNLLVIKSNGLTYLLEDLEELLD